MRLQESISDQLSKKLNEIQEIYFGLFQVQGLDILR